MFTALTGIASKEFTVLTAAEIRPMHSLKEHMTTLSDCMGLQFDCI